MARDQGTAFLDRILSISRIILTTQESPIEAACSRYRGDRYRASIRVPMTTIE